MAARRVFYLSNARLTVHHRGARAGCGGPAVPLSFDADAEGFARFARYLERHPDETTYVVADVVEEEFREETIPHVPFWERRALVRARAARAFREARYVHATMLGRESDGRRDDRVLFSAISRPGVLAPWIAAMTERAVPLAGIYSPAMLTGRMLKAIGAQGEHVLVVSLQSDGGLRQTWFRRRRLRLSRLAPAVDLASEGCDAQILAEIERMGRYLDTLPGTAQSSHLDVRVLVHGAMMGRLRRMLRRDVAGTPRADCTLVDVAGVARRLGLRAWIGEATADRLFVHALVERPPSSHYAPPEETRRYTTVRIRVRVNAAAAVLFVGSCGAAGVTFLDGIVEHGQARSLGLQAAVYESRYHAARAELPSAPAESSEIERAVRAVDLLRERRVDPVDLLALLGHALLEFPQVRVEHIVWRQRSDPQSIDGIAADLYDTANDAPAGTDRGGEVRQRGPKVPYQIALVSARIDPFDGDYRAAIETIHRLVGRLSAPTGVDRVRVVDLPLDLRSEQTLTGDADTAADAAAFEIMVALRVVAPEGAEVRAGG